MAGHLGNCCHASLAQLKGKINYLRIRARIEMKANFSAHCSLELLRKRETGGLSEALLLAEGKHLFLEGSAQRPSQSHAPARLPFFPQVV